MDGDIFSFLGVGFLTVFLVFDLDGEDDGDDFVGDFVGVCLLTGEVTDGIATVDFSKTGTLLTTA